MSEAFIPLVPVKTGSREASFTALQIKGLSGKGSPSAAPPGAEGGSEACSKPVVTLQRNGEVVSGIRIQCGCGQVVDLACVY
jgi:hypothetical protein